MVAVVPGSLLLESTLGSEGGGAMTASRNAIESAIGDSMSWLEYLIRSGVLPLEFGKVLITF